MVAHFPAPLRSLRGVGHIDIGGFVDCFLLESAILSGESKNLRLVLSADLLMVPVLLRQPIEFWKDV
jgi:hypothetical protein